MTIPSGASGSTAAAEAAQRRQAELARMRQIEAQRAREAAQKAAEQNKATPEAVDNTKVIDKDTFMKETQIEGRSEEQLGQLYDKYNTDGAEGLSDDEFNAAFDHAVSDQPLEEAPAAPAAPPAAAIGPDSSPEEIAAMQQKLVDAGIDPGPVDGIYGPITTAGVKAYMDQQGLAGDPATASSEMMTKLNPPPAVEAPPAADPAIKAATDAVNGALAEPPKPGDTLDAAGNPDPGKTYDLERQGDDLQRQVDGLPDGPEKQALQGKVDAFKDAVSDTLHGEREASAAVKDLNALGEVTPDELNDMNPDELKAHYKQVGEAQKKLENNPKLQSETMKQFDAQLKNLEDGDNSGNDREIAEALIDSGVDLGGLSQAARQNLLKVTASHHDSDMGDDKRGPQERLQEVFDSLLNDPALDRGELESAIKGFAEGDSQNRLIDFAKPEQLSQLSSGFLTELNKGHDNKHDKGAKLQEAAIIATRRETMLAGQTPETPAPQPEPRPTGGPV